MESSDEIRDDSTAHKLTDVAENLRRGHGILSKAQFLVAVQSGELEIWQLPEGSHALIGWGTCEEGEACHIVTVTGDAENGQVGLEAIEQIAKTRGAKLVMTIARAGWTQLLQDNGYETTPKVLAKKVLT
jgi:hypothetical protein